MGHWGVEGKHNNFIWNHQKENQTTIFDLNQFISEKLQIKTFCQNRLRIQANTSNFTKICKEFLS